MSPSGLSAMIPEQKELKTINLLTPSANEL